MGNKTNNVSPSPLLCSLIIWTGGGGLCLVLYSLPCSDELVQLNRLFALFF